MVQIARHEKYQNATLECLFRLLPIMFFFTWVRSNFLVCLILELTPPWEMTYPVILSAIPYLIYMGAAKATHVRPHQIPIGWRRKKRTFSFF
jgi:hypothetical protein